jgi:hypothetical protein
MVREMAVTGGWRVQQGIRDQRLTSWFCAPVSLTQMNFSDSIVTLLKEINWFWMPRDGSCNKVGGIYHH